MKRIFGLMFSLLAAVLLVGCAQKTTAAPAAAEKVAMITDYGDITDQSFNQATYEGCKSWCEANGVQFKYYRPAGNTTADRVSSCEQAIEAGYTILVMPGFAFAGTIEEVAGPNPDIKIIALDVSAGDFSQGYQLPSNVYCAVYQEEIAGFLAGYAAVKEGYTKLGFLGGMAVPAVVRYGQGFVQGADKAANGQPIEIKYCYGGQFFGDAAVTARMTTWYSTGTEVVFACGGGIYTSACEAAVVAGESKKVIGVDVDQSYTINADYGAGRCITSAMKGLSATVQAQLKKAITDKNFQSKIETLGLVSGTDPLQNFVQLPTASWSMTRFTQDNYKALVASLFNGEITVSNSITEHAAVNANTTVDYQADIH